MGQVREPTNHTAKKREGYNNQLEKVRTTKNSDTLNTLTRLRRRFSTMPTHIAQVMPSTFTTAIRASVPAPLVPPSSPSAPSPLPLPVAEAFPGGGDGAVASPLSRTEASALAAFVLLGSSAFAGSGAGVVAPGIKAFASVAIPAMFAYRAIGAPVGRDQKRE